jgi:peptidoglycan/LPS O-acetylase OafA/YrhL
MLGRGAAFFEMSPVSLDTFFILSGFLIGGILLRFKDAPNYYRTFYQRRFVRIFPLYYLWIGLFCLFYFFAQGWGLEPPAHLSSAFYLLSFVFFFQNLVPSVIESTFFVAPTWTLVVEEHFYLLAPICIRRMSPRRLVQVLVAILVIAPILRGVLFEFIGHRDDWADIATRIWSPCRADSLALGVLLAVIWNSEKTREWLRAHAPLSAWGMLAGSSIALSLGYMASANLSHCRFLDVTVGRSAVELASFSLIVYLICRPLSAFGKFLSSEPMRYLGKISYCLYVVHWGVLWMIYRFVLHGGFALRLSVDLTAAAAALLLSLGISAMSWKYLESPLLHGARARRAVSGRSTTQLTALDGDRLRSLAQVK